MKKSLLFILTFLLYTNYIFAQNTELLAHYTLTSDKQDKTGKNSVAKLVNAPISSQGVYLGGQYNEYDAGLGNLLQIYPRQFLYKNFSIELEFKIDDFGTYSRTIFAVGRACRQYVVYVTKDGFLSLGLNNMDNKMISKTKIQAKKWYKVFCTYNSSTQTAQVFLNGKKAIEFRKAYTTSCDYGNDISTTNFGNGSCFKGYIKNLKVYSRATNPSPKNNNSSNNNNGASKNNNNNNSNNNNSTTVKDNNNNSNTFQRVIDVKLPVKPFHDIQFASRPDGQMYLAWSESVKDKKGSSLSGFGKLHITTLDKNFRKKGNDIVLGDLEVRQILAIDNQYMYLIVGESRNNNFVEWYKYDYLEANILYFMKLDTSGRVIFKTTLLGHEGQGPGKIWADNGFGTQYETRLVYNGANFGFYTGIRRNFSSQVGTDDIHEGDMFMVLSKDGKILEDKTQRWSSSHAFYMQMTTNKQGEFLTANIGDAYPFGLIVRNRNQKTSNNIWPQPKVKSGKRYYFGAGRTGGLMVLDDDIFVLNSAIKTGIASSSSMLDISLIQLDKELNIKKTHWLTRTSSINEKRCRGVAVGNKICIIYEEYKSGQAYSEDRSKILILDKYAKVLKTETSKLTCNYSTPQLYTLPNNHVAALKVDLKNNIIQILDIKP